MIEGTDQPYPMNYALRFYVNRTGISYWIHGRDLPGYPASHGCIGLYDEPMQKEQYGIPKDPKLNDAKRLFVWVLGAEPEDDHMISLLHGPRVQIIGQPPGHQPESASLNRLTWLKLALFKSLLSKTVYGVREIMKGLRNAHVIGRAVI